MIWMCKPGFFPGQGERDRFTPSRSRVRLFLVALLGLALASCDVAERYRLQADWSLYKQRFVHVEGRVVDTGNGGISHSEGQGIGLLLAQALGDRATFEKLWTWTQAELQTRGDHLFRWRRRPGTPSAEEDPNDASDGDILIAWALLRAGESWQVEAWRREALEIMSDVKRKLLRDRSGLRVLLPGAAGFEHPDRLTVNLSYWIFPALNDFAVADAEPAPWRELAAAGRVLLRRARFGSAGLPPDWLALGDDIRPDPAHPPRFGYDAVRIPLYLTWSGSVEDRALLEPFERFLGRFDRFLPAWVDLHQDCLTLQAAPSGFQAIRRLTLQASGKSAGAWPEFSASEDYYAASLILLSRLATLESSP